MRVGSEEKKKEESQSEEEVSRERRGRPEKNDIFENDIIGVYSGKAVGGACRQQQLGGQTFGFYPGWQTLL